MRVSIVIPTIDESDNLAALLPEMFAIKKHEISVLICNYGEDARTLRLIDAFPKAKFVLVGEKGLGPAVLAGLRVALRGGKPPDVIVAMDADLSHSADDLGRLLSAFGRRETDLLIGSRYVPGGRIVGWRFLRRFLSRTANLLARAVLRSGVSDLTSGFRLYSPRAARFLLASADLPAHAYSFQLASAIRLERGGFGVSEHPIIFRERVAGRSKTFSFAGLSGFARTLLKLI